MIWVAKKAPHAASVLATQTTAVVVPDQLTMVPKQHESKNWARKTMDDTMATSVPRPRTPPSFWTASPSAVTANYQNIGSIEVFKINAYVYVMLTVPDA